MSLSLDDQNTLYSCQVIKCITVHLLQSKFKIQNHAISICSQEFCGPNGTKTNKKTKRY